MTEGLGSQSTLTLPDQPITISPGETVRIRVAKITDAQKSQTRRPKSVDGLSLLGRNLSQLPSTTRVDQLGDIKEERPPGSGHYETRKDVMVIPVGLDGAVYFNTVTNRYYFQRDPLGSSVMTYYGPVEGNPFEVLPLDNVIIQNGLRDDDPQMKERAERLILGLTKAPSEELRGIGRDLQSRVNELRKVRRSTPNALKPRKPPNIFEGPLPSFFRGLDLSKAPSTKGPPKNGDFDLNEELITVRLFDEAAQVFHVPKHNRFYVQRDSMLSSVLTYYGPFDGNPFTEIGLSDAVFQLATQTKDPETANRMRDLIHQLTAHEVPSMRTVGESVTERLPDDEHWPTRELAQKLVAGTAQEEALATAREFVSAVKSGDFAKAHPWAIDRYLTKERFERLQSMFNWKDTHVERLLVSPEMCVAITNPLPVVEKAGTTVSLSLSMAPFAPDQWRLRDIDMLMGVEGIERHVTEFLGTFERAFAIELDESKR